MVIIDQMSIIVKSSWKNKANGDEVEYKGVIYTIGSDAFATVEAAVAAGCTGDLVIVDKKLTSPVSGEAIVSAATDIFTATETEKKSKDGKSETETIQFTAAAGGTAAMKNESALTGFEKISVTGAGGSFFGGKQDVSIIETEVNDDKKDLLSENLTASRSTTATGSLDVNSAEAVDVTAGGITDTENLTDAAVAMLGDAYAFASGNEDYEATPAASYANVTLKNVASESAFNGGSVSENASLYLAVSGDTTITREYTYSYTGKTGSGTATLTDSGTGEIIGYKNVRIASKNVEGDLVVGDISAGSESESYFLQKSYTQDSNYSINSKTSVTDSVDGTLTVTGKEGQMVVTNYIGQFSSAALKFVRMGNAEDGEIDSWAGSSQENKDFSAVKNGDDVALTYSDTSSSSKTAQGVLTISDSSVGSLQGIKTLTLSDSHFESADAMNQTFNYSEKWTGFSSSGISDDMSLDDLDASLSNTHDVTEKSTRTSVGTAALIDAEPGSDLFGYKTVTITLEDSESVSAYGNIGAGNAAYDHMLKTSYEVDKSATYDETVKVTNTAAGTLSAAGSKTIAFAVEGSIDNYTAVDLKNATVGGVGMTDETSFTQTDKKSAYAQGDRTALSRTESNVTVYTAVGSLNAANSTVGSIDLVKTVSLANSKFNTAIATNSKLTHSLTENGYTDDEISPTVITSGLDFDQTYSQQLKEKEEYSVGGTDFTFSGKTIGEDNNVSIEGYKSVSLENKNAEEAGFLTASLSNNTETTETIWKSNYDPDKSFSGSEKTTLSFKSVGDAFIRGYTAAQVEGFASVKAAGRDYETRLTGVYGFSTMSQSRTITQTGKPAKGIMKDEYNFSKTRSRKAASTLDASKAVLSGYYENLKTVNLQNVNLSNAVFVNEGDIKETTKENIKWDSNDLREFANPVVTAVEDWDYNNPEAVEKVTSANITENVKSTVVGDFILSNDKNSTIEGLSIHNFKNVDITVADSDPVGIIALSVNSDTALKTAFKYTASEAKKTLSFSETATTTSVGSLAVTGKSTNAAVTTLDMAADKLDFAAITLKDAVIANEGAVSNSYEEKSSYTISESVAADGSASVKVTKTYSKTGNGKFTASVSKLVNEEPAVVFAGTLNGYGNISLSNVSIGNVDNFKQAGTGEYVVPFRGDEYFDVYAYNKADEPGELPAGAVSLYGDISGSFTIDKNGQINSNWKGIASETASGTFTMDAKNAGAVAGNIQGYDKVTLTGVATVGNIEGGNRSESAVLTYKTANNEVTDTEVWTEMASSSNSVVLTGKKIGSAMQVVTAGNIYGYKSVSLDNAVVGSVEADDSMSVETIDNVKETMTTNITRTAAGTLTATDSIINGEVYGFRTVTLTDTDAEVDFDGTSVTRVDVSDRPYPTFYESKVSGFFTAGYTGENPEAGFAVGAITGYQQVRLTDYSAGNVAAGNTVSETFVNTLKVTPGDENKGTPDVIKMAASTKGNSFTAAAVVDTAMTVGDVEYYGKVETSDLLSIDSVINARWEDDVWFDMRKYSGMHYGDGSMTSSDDGEVIRINALNVDATAASVIISGTEAEKNTAAKLTAVTGNILGYGKVTLSNVILSGDEPVGYTAGKYAYTTKTSKDGDFVALSTSSATGTLSISSAKAAEDTVIAVEGFKEVSIDITGEGTAAPLFASIIGGTETAQLTNGELDYTTYDVSGTLELATAGGTVGYVAGFEKATLKDTDAGIIIGYATEAKQMNDEWESVSVGKASITFENTSADGNTIGSIENAKSVTFKASDDTDTDFIVGEIWSAEDVDLEVLIEQCQTTMDFQLFRLNGGDEIKLTSTGVFGDGTWSTILLEDLTTDTLATYFDSIEGASLSGKGTLMAAVTEDQFKEAVENKVAIGNNIAFQSLLA